jgi:hypothetical protein
MFLERRKSHSSIKPRSAITFRPSMKMGAPSFAYRFTWRGERLRYMAISP